MQKKRFKILAPAVGRGVSLAAFCLALMLVLSPVSQQSVAADSQTTLTQPLPAETQPASLPRVGGKLIPLGKTTGIKLFSRGTMVVGFSELESCGRCPARDGGLQEGDVLLKLNGQDITGNESLTALLAELPDENARFTVLRDEQEQTVPVKAVYDKVCAEHSNNIGKKFVMGASSGGYFTWQLLEDYTDFFDAAMPMASGYVPSDEALDRIRDNGIDLIIAHGKYDELASFDEYILPRMEKLTKLKNCICFFPEWVYNGDGGVASVFFGIEMGQHCIINWVQHNLIFDNGIPADNRLPDGVTGWIKSVCAG